MNQPVTSTLPAEASVMHHSATRKVLVVGATGFLGAKIQRQLELGATVTLRAMSRRGAHADARTAVEWVRGRV